jgi:hypothetical protein
VVEAEAERLIELGVAADVAAGQHPAALVPHPGGLAVGHGATRLVELNSCPALSGPCAYLLDRPGVAGARGIPMATASCAAAAVGIPRSAALPC